MNWPPDGKEHEFFFKIQYGYLLFKNIRIEYQAQSCTSFRSNISAFVYFHFWKDHCFKLTSVIFDFKHLWILEFFFPFTQ